MRLQSNVLQDGEIVSGMAGTGTHLVVGEGDVYAPVQADLDSKPRPRSSANNPPNVIHLRPPAKPRQSCCDTLFRFV